MFEYNNYINGNDNELMNNIKNTLSNILVFKDNIDKVPSIIYDLHFDYDLDKMFEKRRWFTL